VLSDNSPLYTFGYGLSYTTFEYSNLQISQKSITTDGSTDISIDVRNSGTMKGDEIVQLYIHKLVSLPTRPIKELKDFKRISLNAGELQTVHFQLTNDKLAAIGMDMRRTVPTGTFEILVGKNSVDLLRDTLIVK
jgi:beta-glucosidase